MEHSDLGPDSDGYYRENLLSLCKALVILGGAPNTGDWWYELIGYLEACGTDAEKANVKPRQLALDIYQQLTKMNILEVFALIKEEPK